MGEIVAFMYIMDPFLSYYAQLLHKSYTYLKFSFSEKATKIWRNRLQGFDVTMSKP